MRLPYKRNGDQSHCDAYLPSSKTLHARNRPHASLARSLLKYPVPPRITMVANFPGSKMDTPFLWPTLDLLPKTNDNTDYGGPDNSALNNDLRQLRLTADEPDDWRSVSEDEELTDSDARDEYIAKLRARIYERYVACTRLQAKISNLALEGRCPDAPPASLPSHVQSAAPLICVGQAQKHPHSRS
jgi:hypothetical protein